MPDDIRISVCIPTYNKYETIEYTVLSVINQSFNNWELLIIDYSNNDLTKNIVKKYSNDPRIKYYKNIARNGIVKNWNECIRKANYEYVYILHHDDFLMQDVLINYHEFAKANPECGLIHSNCFHFTLPYLTKTIGTTQNCKILQSGDNAVEKILFNNNLACSSVMVKKECYEKVGMFDESAWVSPDWEMWARIGKDYNLGHLDIIGCAVIIDNKNTHLSAIDINLLYKQQQYYYKKIVSYFSSKYIAEHPFILEEAEKNLKNTILNLSFYYFVNFKIGPALSYIKKIKFYKLYKVPFLIIKSLLKHFYFRIFKLKADHKYLFYQLFSEKS